MKTCRAFITTSIAVAFVLIAASSHAQIGGINSAGSTATIKFDDQNSYFGLLNGAFYTQNTTPWTGSTVTLSQIDPTTGDVANGDISAFGAGSFYNFALNNVYLSQPGGNTGYADLIYSFSVDYAISSTWLAAPTYFPTFLVNGTVQSTSSSYAMVRGQIDYYALNTASVYGLVDQVSYNWLYNTPGTFVNQTVTGTAVNGTLGNIAAGSTMTMNGTIIFEVDPANFTVTTVPEPGTLAIIGLGGAGLLAFRRKFARK